MLKSWWADSLYSLHETEQNLGLSVHLSCQSVRHGDTDRPNMLTRPINNIWTDGLTNGRSDGFSRLKL